MLGEIVSQNGQEVKCNGDIPFESVEAGGRSYTLPGEETCTDEHCHEYVFRDSLCLEHFTAVETAAWDDHDDEVAQAHAVSVGRG